ncbi:MAG: 50S ribosomal protein L22 [Ktedonobacter sp. 13_1_40CM_4_52_4]|jgi:large subunit ribosomal protein L22|nr:MAG: 50S ribosomal protein L22 [Ktedonobacter sp. 13_1_40CM_4_52_4]
MRASATHIRIAPRKVRTVVDTVRGKSVSQALSILAFTRKKAALPVQKLLKSAVANAAENNGISDVDTLVIDRIMVDEGPTLKRYMPRARGRATPIRKRTSHIRIILRERGTT